MRHEHLAQALATLLLLLVAGCQHDRPDTGQEAKQSAPSQTTGAATAAKPAGTFGRLHLAADGSLDMLHLGQPGTPISPGGGLHTGRAQWEKDQFVLGVHGVPTQFAFRRVVPAEYELVLQGIAPNGSLTIYAPGVDYDSYIPLRLKAGNLDADPLKFKPSAPLDVSIRVWQDHILATVNGQVAIAHAGDLREKSIIVEPLRRSRLPVVLQVNGGALRLSRLSLRDISAEQPDFVAKTTTSPTVLGQPWPVDQEFWFLGPKQPDSRPWSDGDMTSVKTPQGIRLQAKHVRRDITLMYRGVLSGDFRWSARLRDARDGASKNDLKGLVAISLEGLTGSQASFNVNLNDTGKARDVDIQRTAGKVTLRLDAASLSLTDNWHRDDDVHVALRMRRART